MSSIVTYFLPALQGMERYLGANKLVAVLLAALLAAWLLKIVPDRKGNNLLVYVTVMCVLLLCPVTAVVILQYQTSFYDYEWAWSMVPITAAIAYVGTLLFGRIAEKKKQTVIAVGAVLILILCGNQGAFQKMSPEDAEAAIAVPEIAKCLNQEIAAEQIVVWAPRNIMQGLRRFNGKILLVYGRDMWDGKSGAYDYEAYSGEIINAYECLNIVLEEMENAQKMADPLFALKTISAEKELYVQVEESILSVIDEGANTIILPNLMAECYADTVRKIAEQKAMILETAYVEEYTIFLLQ